MSLIDYKISRIDNGIALVRFYEGDVTTEDEEDGNGGIISVTRYRRSSLIRETTYTLSRMELRKRLNGILTRDRNRPPISEQRA